MSGSWHRGGSGQQDGWCARRQIGMLLSVPFFFTNAPPTHTHPHNRALSLSHLARSPREQQHVLAAAQQAVRRARARLDGAKALKHGTERARPVPRVREASRPEAAHVELVHQQRRVVQAKLFLFFLFFFCF